MYRKSKSQLWKELLADGQFFGYVFELDKEVEGFNFTYWCSEALFAIKLLNDKNPESGVTAKDKRLLLEKGIKVITITPAEVHADFAGTEEFITNEFTLFARTNCGT